MRRWEDFNKTLNQNESPEAQAAAMIIADISDNVSEISDTMQENLLTKFKMMYAWLNEEKESEVEQ